MTLDSVANGRQLHDFFQEVFKLQHLLSRIMDTVHEQSGLSTPKRRLAETLEEGDEMTVPEAAAKLGVSRQFVQTQCNEMAALGLLSFADNPRHKRSKLIFLTRQGRERLNRAKRIEAEIIEQSMPPVDAKAVLEATSLAAALREWLMEAVEKLGCGRAGVGAGE